MPVLEDEVKQWQSAAQHAAVHDEEQRAVYDL